MRCLADAARSTYDLAVVGGGVMGVWTAIMARKRGASVLLADQFAPAHERGSSHGDGRIYRVAYTEDHYVDMMLRSLPHWHELETFAAEPLLATTGGINIATIGTGRLDSQADLFAARGIAHEWLSASQTNERFPQFRLDNTQHALFQPDFGVLFASKCVSSAWRYAEHLGVDTMIDFRASGFFTGENGVIVEGQDGAPIFARAAVFAPGAWLSSLTASLFDVHVPTMVTAETVCYYAPKDTPESAAVDHSYNSMPVFIPEMTNGLGPFGYYGLPMIDIPGIKCSAHYCGPEVHPDRRPQAAGGIAPKGNALYSKEEVAAAAQVDAVVQSTSRYVASTFPHVEHRPFLTQSCLYTTTCDHDYIISRIPGMSNVVLAGGGSGHAFKMGPAIGEGAASLALGQEAPLSMDRFAVERLLGGDARNHNLVADRK